ncbi:hypothetical protein K1719_044346 [Acacia pycnantha]|nr:hypothetical protein K1719_044346 [Acacia pycnantha]
MLFRKLSFIHFNLRISMAMLPPLVFSEREGKLYLENKQQSHKGQNESDLSQSMGDYLSLSQSEITSSGVIAYGCLNSSMLQSCSQAKLWGKKILIQAHGIHHFVIPTRDYLFALSFSDISRDVQFIDPNVYHRDLKPKNILANANCKLKICDLGLARVAFSDSPTTIFWTVCNSIHSSDFNSSIHQQPVPFAQKFPNADPLALRLLERLIAFDPKDRPTAEEALADPYFKRLAKFEREPSCQPISKMEFEFERRRVTKEEIRELIFREILEYHPQLLKDYINGTERPNFLYPSAVDHFRKQFVHLEENNGKNGPTMPLERKHVSLPRYYSKFMPSCNLLSSDCCEVYNLGTGKGTSVLKIVRAFGKASGKVVISCEGGNKQH